jgi:hypothetical protein
LTPAPVAGTKFSVTRLESDGPFVAIAKTDAASILPFDLQLLSNFGKAFSQYYPMTDGIPCFTEHHRIDYDANVKYIFRGHPLFRGREWHDWAYFQWTKDGSNDDSSSESSVSVEVPAKILFFADLSNIEHHPNYKPGLYAVVKSMTKEPVSVPGSKLLKRMSTNPRISFNLCDVESIVDVAFVIENIGLQNDFFIVESPTVWPKYF